MPIGIYEKDDIDAIANSIRNGIGEETKYTTKQMPDKINEMQVYAYNNGHIEGYGEGRNEGYAEGKTDGIAEGKKSQYDEFWDVYQNYGKRTNYNYGFAGFGFNPDNFYPKYDIKPTGYVSYMFYAWETTKHKMNLKERLIDCGVVLDTSKMTNMSSMFNYVNFRVIPTIDCTGLSGSSTDVFSNNYGRTVEIEKIITKESVTYANWFFNTNLTEIRFEGIIGQDINFQWSTNLTHESLMSIINALKDYIGTATWKTITLGADNIAKLTQEELDIMHLKQWEYT